MNAWLVSALVLVAALVPLGIVAGTRPFADGVVALQAAGSDTVLILLLLAEGLHRQPFVDLSLVLAVLAFVGALVIAGYLEYEHR